MLRLMSPDREARTMFLPPLSMSHFARDLPRTPVPPIMIQLPSACMVVLSLHIKPLARGSRSLTEPTLVWARY